MLSLLVFLTGIALHAPTPAAPDLQAPLAHFRLVFEPSDSGVVAHCETGCTWKVLSFRCAAGCRALVDANGVALNPDAQPSTSPFAFRLHQTLDGWTAESVRGTAWVSLTYGCGTVPCLARVDEFGVSGVAPKPGP